MRCDDYEFGMSTRGGLGPPKSKRQLTVRYTLGPTEMQRWVMVGRIEMRHLSPFDEVHGVTDDAVPTMLQPAWEMTPSSYKAREVGSQQEPGHGSKVLNGERESKDNYSGPPGHDWSL